VARRRARWKAHQGRINPSRLVFIDETWVKTNMAPLRGWGPRGRRLKAYAPFGHWKTLTFIAALRHDRIDAPWVIDGPINGELFLLYIKRVLAPTLSPGDIVVLDNLGSHKGKAARAAVRAKGAHLLFLPPYSPDLKPYRTGLRKAQTPDAQGPAPRCRNNLAKGRPTPRTLQPQRMRKLPHERRIWFRLKESRSRCQHPSPARESSIRYNRGPAR
jgi:transposase